MANSNGSDLENVMQNRWFFEEHEEIDLKQPPTFLCRSAYAIGVTAILEYASNMELDLAYPLTLGEPVLLGHEATANYRSPNSSNAPISTTALGCGSLDRHLHLIGSTGSGKTTALLTVIRQRLTAAVEWACIFVIDPMGNLSQDLLRWMANARYCPRVFESDCNTSNQLAKT